jgi:hypothetical protein
VAAAPVRPRSALLCVESEGKQVKVFGAFLEWPDGAGRDVVASGMFPWNSIILR